MIPGLVYIKTAMGPDIADDIEKLATVYGFSKTKHGLVLPLSDEQASSLEKIASKKEKDIEDEYKLMKKDEYVSVVAGDHEGRYGILQGTKRGKLEVILRGEYKDEWDLFELDQLKYLENPPEKKWKEMSAKEAIESLMSKDPRNPTIQALKKEGLLSEILYSNDDDSNNDHSQNEHLSPITKQKNENNDDGDDDDDDLDQFLEGLLENKLDENFKSNESKLGNTNSNQIQDVENTKEKDNKMNHNRLKMEESEGPSMDDYENFGDYLEAVVNQARTESLPSQ
jgi:hypothetical protein